MPGEPIVKLFVGVDATVARARELRLRAREVVERSRQARASAQQVRVQTRADYRAEGRAREQERLEGSTAA